MNYADKPDYVAKDFVKGQEVYLRVVTGSNMARHFGIQTSVRLNWENPPALDGEYMSERIVKGTVTSIGRKYLTVKPERGYYPEVKFDLTNALRQSVDSGSVDFEVFKDRRDAEEDVRFEYYYQRIHFGFRSPFHYTYQEIEKIYGAMFLEQDPLQYDRYTQALMRIAAHVEKLLTMREDIRKAFTSMPDPILGPAMPGWANEFVDAGYPTDDLWKFTVMKVFAFHNSIQDTPKDTAWYFTCGSDASFPFQNSFAICYAASEEDAVALYRQRYPHAHENTPEGVANCSWIYPERKWEGTESQKVFGDMPEVVIF